MGLRKPTGSFEQIRCWPVDAFGLKTFKGQTKHSIVRTKRYPVRITARVSAKNGCGMQLRNKCASGAETHRQKERARRNLNTPRYEPPAPRQSPAFFTQVPVSQCSSSPINDSPISTSVRQVFPEFRTSAVYVITSPFRVLPSAEDNACTPVNSEGAGTGGRFEQSVPTALGAL